MPTLRSLLEKITDACRTVPPAFVSANPPSDSEPKCPHFARLRGSGKPPCYNSSMKLRTAIASVAFAASAPAQAEILSWLPEEWSRRGVWLLGGVIVVGVVAAAAVYYFFRESPETRRRVKEKTLEVKMGGFKAGMTTKYHPPAPQVAGEIPQGADPDKTRKGAECEDAQAQFALGLMYYKGEGVPQDYAAAAKWFRRAAEQGDAVAQNNLGVMYHEGKGVARDDAAAVKWYRLAAEQGDADAQFNLGQAAYHNGEGVPQDYAAAAKWYRLAAEQGFAHAQSSLGVAYHKGEGVPQDYAAAAKWFRRAAEQGDAVAQNNLGVMYHEGKGVARDDAEAAKWYCRAAEQGLPQAKASLEDLRKGGVGGK